MCVPGKDSMVGVAGVAGDGGVAGGAGDDTNKSIKDKLYKHTQ